MATVHSLIIIKRRSALSMNDNPNPCSDFPPPSLKIPSSLNVPSIFISYSQSNDEHKEWVRKLAHKLSNFNINIHFDGNLDGSQKIPQFMDQGIQKATFIILICDDFYVKKANNTRSRSGVRYEINQIKKRMLVEFNLENYLIPIWKNNHNNQKKILKDFDENIYYHDFDNTPENYNFAKIIFRIFDLNNLLSQNISNEKNITKSQELQRTLFMAIEKYWTLPINSKEEQSSAQNINTMKTPHYIQSNIHNTNFQNNNVYDDCWEEKEQEKLLVGLNSWNTQFEGDNKILNFLLKDNNHD